MLTSTFYHPRKCQKLCLFLCPYATNRYILAHIKWKSVFGESEHSLPSDNFPPKEIFTQDRNSDVYSVSTIYNIFLCVGVLHCSPKRTKFLTSVHLPNIYTLTQKKNYFKEKPEGISQKRNCFLVPRKRLKRKLGIFKNELQTPPTILIFPFLCANPVFHPKSIVFNFWFFLHR